jgi:O-methyltransferase
MADKQRSPLYDPRYSPWLDDTSRFAEFYRLGADHTVVSRDRLWVLGSLLQQALDCVSRGYGEIWECGVYRGGSAKFIAEMIEWRHFAQAIDRKPTLRLFDTFAGMPATDDAVDWHKQGDFADTSLAAVQALIGNKDFVHYHPGVFPESAVDFPGQPIAFAHIDVDIYWSVAFCCQRIYPLLQRGGFMLFDDYGFDTCAGARDAVDTYFGAPGMPVPLVLHTGQAVVFKS